MRPSVQHALCALCTAALLATVSPPRLDAQAMLALASPPPVDETTTVTVQDPTTNLPARSVDLEHTPAESGEGPVTMRHFSAGYAAGPVTVGVSEIGPEPADCASFETAPAGGRTAGGRACASPIRVKLAWW